MRFLAYLILTSVSVNGAIAARQPRVYLGQEDRSNEFPFAVSLQTIVPRFRRTCSGSLISPIWVITVAHCIYPAFIDFLLVRYADFNLHPNETKSFVNVIKVIRHPSFDNRHIGRENDIGLILVDEVPTNSFATLSAIDYKTMMGLPVTFAGYGATKIFYSPFITLVSKEEDLTRPLQIGEAMVIPCVTRVKQPAICLAPRCSKKHQSARFGDSGGPVILNGKLVGMNAGFPTLEIIKVGVYLATPVSPYLEWILNVMNTGI